MKIYNSLTRKVEEFIPHNKKEVTMYTCGPTVYYYAHIGNLRTYISEDILEKGLNYLGYKVKRCMNITDVGHLTGDSDTGNDKMSVAAKKEKKSVLDIAKFYTNAFYKDMEKLNNKIPDIVSSATDNIDKYIEMIEKLLKDGYAYKSGGNVYFDTSKFPNYYELSGRSRDEMLLAVRDDVEVDEKKKNPFDFGLWFTDSKFNEQQLKWDSPFGVGYPGWHIECSVIAISNLGEYLDIHCGGIDNLFPHHTNEIAQSESYLGHKWCKYWVHMEFLNDKSGKMSKSNGDSKDLNSLIEKGYDPIVYRYFCLQSHYRKTLVYSLEGLDIATNAYNKLKRKINFIKNNRDGEIDDEAIEMYQNMFKDAFSNDMNTSMMLTVLYDVIKSDINNNTKYYLIEDFDKVLSLNLLKDEEVSSEFLDYVNKKIEERNKAKEDKNYKLADEIREELKLQKVIIKDTREGTTFEVLR
ncbi:MAG: cysteine--tRNA ligase [Bacilli bacterium]|nr:cysteine--tRNA ligase [Bacilli bacterium]